MDSCTQKQGFYTIRDACRMNCFLKTGWRPKWDTSDETCTKIQIWEINSKPLVTQSK